jgi:hypothetical protein
MALFLEQPYQPVLLRHEFVDVCYFIIEQCGTSLLFEYGAIGRPLR